MIENNPLLLLTRPQAQADRFARLLQSKRTENPRFLIASLLEIVPFPEQLDVAAFDFFIFSSMNGVIAEATPIQQKAFCVGERTAERARSRGFDVIAVTKTVEDLILWLAQHQPIGRGLYARGSIIRQSVISDPRLEALKLEERVVYDQIPKVWPKDISAKIQREPRIIAPVFSPRSAIYLAKALSEYRGDLCCIALSDAVRDDLPLDWKHRSIVCPEPTTKAMVRVLQSVYGC
ncbi:MAG: uroporphyrinogen-III synthase [Pseudoruegeria sp.]